VTTSDDRTASLYPCEACGTLEALRARAARHEDRRALESSRARASCR
jgi:hypothetical protein